MEDVAHLYFMDLLRRSFFQDVEMNVWGNIISCKMHDLIHDLANLVAGPQSSIVNLDAQYVPPKIRHVSFDVPRDSSWEIPIPLFKANKLRTFFLPYQGHFRKLHVSVTVPTFLRSPTSKRLRVLDLHNLGITTLPSCISKLKQLRYLDLSRNFEIKTLPSSVTKLQNLRTLKLNGCSKLVELPRDIRRMVSLRHLELEECYDLTCMPFGLGELTSLRTLMMFRLREERDGMIPVNGGLSELRGLNNLRGNLKILSLGSRCLKSATSEQTEEENYLKGMEYLDSLELCWLISICPGRECIHDYYESVLEGLQPHQNLKKLFISGYIGVKFPSWMMVNIGLSLPNLVKLDIKGCGWKYLQQFGQLPSLQVLKLSFCSLEYIDNGGSSGGVDMSLCSVSYSSSATFFPSLRFLSLCQLGSLKGWWSGKAEEPITMTTAADQQQQHLFSLPILPSFPRLSTLFINVCNKVTSVPLSPHVEELRLRWVSWKLVHQLMMMSTATIPMTTTTTVKTLSSSSSPVPLSKLKILCIEDVVDLVSLPEEAFQNLTSLRYLKISGCRRLTSLSRRIQHLTALERLQLYDCNDLSSDDDVMQFQGLQNLTSLTIGSIQKSESLPIGLQYVTTLQSLEISRCGLKSLPEWICNLTSLQKVVWSECCSLTSLPEGMRQLTTSQELRISCCPNFLRH
ncbi:putative disease resistance protein RGA1 [Cornus florida]|uniref:putative disease resistance protein RGA1 n=1 Tax=Cornus florida TaxID=4283 RepID=UPI00289D55C4|nr:putative disease resistance protein RGA1 [Cornus florida]XP_059624074.1 putative disease resistance protein RGA1 [Cornus florida]XP_059624075.1 putative disease resistance protein RGA1 [Cornus florida]XP_059624077.1 putative disease resistance protein RGA1 [Cornus florida]XP_059624078.1 putative disease resistance protein RGA1 [Cornus florida]